MELLARIFWDANTLRGLREAVDGLRAVRHTAMGTEAHRAYTEALRLTLDDLYDLAESWGLRPGEA